MSRIFKGRSARVAGLLLSPLFLVTIFNANGHAQDRSAPERVKETANCASCKKLSLNFELGAGEVSITPMADSFSSGAYATADIFYSPRKFRYSWETRQNGEIAELDADSETRSGHHIDRLEENNWDIQISQKLPVTLNLEIGAADAVIDLGGIRIEEAHLDIGASSAEITFLEPNPVRCREFELNSGAAGVSIERFANLHAEEAAIEIGAASLDLDLGGTQQGETTLDLSVRVGSCDIIVPLDLPLRVEGADDSWFSTVDIPRRRMHRVSKGVYETDSFETAKDRMIITLSVGMGSVDFKFR